MRAYCLDNRFLVFPVDPGLLPNHGQAGGHPHTAGTAHSHTLILTLQNFVICAVKTRFTLRQSHKEKN